ncbi:MAG: ABC transporter substrate-binding protein [Nitrospiraceae bacterium]|nr:MAG: ABC transporter substrate-binding protein [Nitrospiraceae bacterium]
MKTLHVVLLMLLTLIVPMNIYAGTPTDTIKAHVDEVLNVLRASPDGSKRSDEAKKAEIRVIAGRMFDFTAMSKATLGNNWNKLDKDQRTEFIKLLKAMLENAYVSKILGYTDEKAVFIGERSLSPTRVEVQSTLMARNADIPMHYRVLKTEDTWKVYDVIIEGVSLVKNYRTQFRQILAKQTPSELLDVMRQKVGEI